MRVGFTVRVYMNPIRCEMVAESACCEITWMYCRRVFFPAGVRVFPTGILQIPQGICLNAIVCVVINISIFSQELFDKKRIPAESRQEKKP